MTTVQPTLLTYTDDQGEPLVQLVHKSVRLRGQAPVKGSQAYEETPDWAVEFVGPFGFNRDGGGLPRELSPARADGVAAKTLADATETLARIGSALEHWMDDRKRGDAALVRRVSAAARYGLDPELPITDDGTMPTEDALTALGVQP